MMDINELLDKKEMFGEDVVGNEVLSETLLSLGRTSLEEEETTNLDKVARINAANKAGDYNVATDRFGAVIPQANEIVASLDEKGQVSVTNVGTSPRAQATAAVGVTRAEALSSTNLHSKVKEIEGMTDISQRYSALATLKSDFEVMRLDAYNQAKTKGYAINGVPELERRVQDMREADQQRYARNPGAYTPSSELAATERALSTARAAAERLAEESVGSNVVLKSMETRLNVAAQGIERGTNRIEASTASQQAREDKKQELVEDVKASVPPQAWERVMRNNPQFTEEAAVDYLMKSKLKPKEEQEVLMARTRDLPELMVKGNKLAEETFINEESARTGQDFNTIKADLQEIKTMTASPANLRKTASMILSPTSAEFKELTALFNAPVAALGKEAKEENKKQMYQAAAFILNRKKTSDFIADVSSWKMPQLDQAVEDIKKIGLEPNATNVMNAYIGTSSGKERAVKLGEFGAYMKKAAKSTEGRTFGEIDGELLMTTIVRANLAEGIRQRAKAALLEARIQGTEDDFIARGMGFNF